MNPMQLRKVAPVVYGLLVVVLWIVAPSSVALTVTIIGALLLGLMYVVTGRQITEQGLGRPRDRTRSRRRG